LQSEASLNFVRSEMHVFRGFAVGAILIGPDVDSTACAAKSDRLPRDLVLAEHFFCMCKESRTRGDGARFTFHHDDSLRHV
jgi:hypothetical protein